MRVSFKLEAHSVKDEYFLTMTTLEHPSEPDVLWLTKKELRKLKDALKDV